MSAPPDAIVIGAGVNGLVAGHTLARAGRRVLVLERRAEADSAPDAGWVPPAVARGLKLAKHGFTVTRPDPWISVALPDGERLELSLDVAQSATAIRRLSPRDAERWPQFATRMRQIGAALEALSTQPAPDVETTQAGELFRLGMLGLGVRRRGRQATIDMLRILPMAAAELLDEWFENDALKAAVGVAGILHLRQGPRSGGTAFVMLHHHLGCAAGVFRPPLSNIGAVLGALPRKGLEVRRGAAVQRITVTGGRATGVVLEGGEEIACPVVISSADPRATLVTMVEPGWLDPDLVLAVRNIKCRGVVARVTASVSRPAGFTTLALAPSLSHLERAYDDAKYGRVSANPYIEARGDDGRVTAHVQYVPHALREGAWDGARRAALGELVVRHIADAVPGFGDTVTSVAVSTPADLEREQGLTEGNAYHGELTLDQILFMRPVAGWSRYRTPIGGLLLAGAGTHPGGAVQGMSGLLCAREAIRQKA